MTSSPTPRPRVLLVEDNPADARLLRELLAEARHDRFEIVHVDRVSAALDRLGEGGIDAMLLDLSLPDGAGLETVTRMLREVPAMPVVVLTGLDDETLALRSVQAGAQDYLVKGHVTSQLLVRAIRYAIERKKTLEEQRRHAEVEATARRSRFLAEAGRMLSASLDTATLLNTIGRIVVPDLGEICCVDLIDDGGKIRRTIAGHGAAIDEQLARALEAYPPDLSAPRSPVAEVIRTGQSIQLERIDQVLLDRTTVSEDQADLWQRAAVRTGVIAPLMAGGRVFGAMCVLRTHDAQRYEVGDRLLFEELAQHAALALDNADLYRKARAAVRARDEMVNVVSHDLRNPLNVVTMSVALLRRTQLPPNVEAIVQRVGRSAEQMLGLINDLLDVARIENGTLAVEVSSQPVDALVNAAVDLLRPLAANRSITLEATLPPDLPPALCDRPRILQVLSNLVGNAIKFTQPGGRIEIDVAAASEGVRVSVRDTGAGIPREQIEHVFDRFWQAKRADRQGAGLGLAIAKAIVEAHRGQIGVDSQLGLGSSFHFVIPTRPAEPAIPSAPRVLAVLGAEPIASR
ncbi:MAG: histidine kinase [Myxococcales bacterium]|nr:histidine kinase [Myxococcales bacterium]